MWVIEDHGAPNTEPVTNVGADRGGETTHDIAKTSDAAPRTNAAAGPRSSELVPKRDTYDLPGRSEGMPTTQADTINVDPSSLRAVLKGHSDMTIYPPELVRRNATFAAGGAFTGLPFPTNPALRVIGCVDSRVDPSDVLGLTLGEAVVMRNIGGRVTPEALRSWALLGRLGAGHAPSGAHLAVLHHTDCGIRRLASYPELLAAFFEIPVADLGSKAVEDPYASVRIDVDLARQRLPLLVSGLVYDVDTGLVEVVVPATTE
jgi:carbonic anhydrase